MVIELVKKIDDQADSFIDTLKNSSSVEERQTALQLFARLFSQLRNSNEILTISKKMAKLFPILNTILVNENEDIRLRKQIISFYKEKTVYPEIYDALKEVLLQGIEEDLLSLEAGRKMLFFVDRFEESKTTFLELLQSKKEYHRLLGVRLIFISKNESNYKEYNYEWDYYPLFMQIVKEDKSPTVRRDAWRKVTGRKGKEFGVQFLLNDVLQASLYEVLTKFQSNIQVPLTRIIELTENLPYQKIKNLVGDISENNVKISKEQYEEAIKQLLKSKQITGEYFELEQVFVRKNSEDTPIKPVSFSKEYICYHCGNPLDKEAKTCAACNSEALRCSVCKLPISFGEEVGKCSLCETKGHLVHMQEWVKVKGKCPTCMKKIPIEGVVPISGVEVTK